MKMKFSIGLLWALSATPLAAQDYVVKVHGIVCEFCSLGVAKKVAKLPFIDASRHNRGVDVDVENQTVTIAVQDGVELDRDVLFAAIESGGYNPIEMSPLDDQSAVHEAGP